MTDHKISRGFTEATDIKSIKRDLDYMHSLYNQIKDKISKSLAKTMLDHHSQATEISDKFDMSDNTEELAKRLNIAYAELNILALEYERGCIREEDPEDMYEDSGRLDDIDEEIGELKVIIMDMKSAKKRKRRTSITNRAPPCGARDMRGKERPEREEPNQEESTAKESQTETE